MKISVQDIKNLKNTQKITCLTAYSYPIAKILDESCELILVGDSLGMAVYGHEDTLDVTLDMMINHGRAVTKAISRSLVVVDLPFGTYEKSKEQALKSAKEVVSKTGCDAIKIETTLELVSTAKFLVENGINVMGHIGLLPQHVREIGGYKYQGKNEESAQKLIESAKELERVGVFSIVIEAVPAKLADQITKEISIPTIGIGASRNCDGQILVIDDLLGLNQEFTPKFVKKYSHLSQEISKAVKAYDSDIQAQKFPTPENEL